MTRIDTALLVDVAAFVDALDADHCQPVEARVRLGALRGAHLEHHIDLVSDVEAFDGRVAYDIVVQQSDGIALSVAVSSGLGLPWPLRGVARASEQHLLRVGTVQLEVGEALACLDFWDDRSLLEKLVNACIIAVALDQDPIEICTSDLQQAANAFRRFKGLFSYRDTQRWLAARNLSEGNFAALVERAALVDRLRRRVTAGNVEPWFQANQASFARISAVWAEVSVPTTGPSSGAGPLALEANPLGAVLAARREGRMAGFGEWRVGDLPDGLTKLRDAAVGTAIEVEVEGLAAHALVLEVVPSVLDARTRVDVERALFDHWLAEQRKNADIEWFWGNSALTSKAV